MSVYLWCARWSRAHQMIGPKAVALERNPRIISSVNAALYDRCAHSRWYPAVIPVAPQGSGTISETASAKNSLTHARHEIEDYRPYRRFPLERCKIRINGSEWWHDHNQGETTPLDFFPPIGPSHRGKYFLVPKGIRNVAF